MALVRRFAAAAVVALVVASATAAPAENGGADVVEPSSGIMGGLHVLYNSLSQCEASEDMGSCLKLKAIRSLERALASDRLELVDGVALSRAEGQGQGARAMPPPFEERALPSDPAQKQEVLDALLADRAQRLFSTRSLSFAVPRAVRRFVEGVVAGEDAQDSHTDASQEAEEGRGRKKGHGILYLGLLWKGWMTLMAYKGVALLAGKALMTATIALVLAGILALSKLTHHEKQHTTVEIVRHPHVTHSYSHSASHEHLDDHNGGGGGGHGWGRALREEEEEQRRRREQRGALRDGDVAATSGQGQLTQPEETAQQLAYRAYHQRQLQQQQQQQQQQQVQYQYQTQPQQPVLQPQGDAMSVPL